MARTAAKARRKPAAQPAPPAGPDAAAAARPVLTVRHYCQGIGDCHLLSFPRPDGSLFRMLIDCGIHSSVAGGAELIREIAADIATETGGRLDVLVVTHEHWDHVSGFVSAASVFQGFSIGEVWMAWSEDPDDPDAVAFDRFKGAALAALQGASLRLDGLDDPGDYVAGLRDGLQSVMGFEFGAAGERVRAARDAAAALASRQPPVYLGPETAPFTLPGLANLRVYVLGPPRGRQALRLETKAGEIYPPGGNAAAALLRPLQGALAVNDGGGGALDDDAPFDAHVGISFSGIRDGSEEGATADFVRRRYHDPLPAGPGKPGINDATLRDQSWRRIDADWLAPAADLAMQLDRGVNNTSLVLAFEVVDGGRVFLFPGDAQIGSWLSWQDVEWTVGEAGVKAADLMARTVYLKVAHHGSENATPSRSGLDLMTSPDLSAFIPTSKADARKVHWAGMPYDAILTALSAKTAGRVLRADDDWLALPGGSPAFTAPSGSILAVRGAARDARHGKGGLWVEVDLA